jgi:hypothetical protein
MRDQIKATAGQIIGAVNPQCRYDRAIFILAHMRCGSTALSNVLCSRPDVSGYGEAHVRYADTASLGRLVVNQALRKAWKPGARYLFDKILHNRHDAAAPPAFFTTRAIFMARDPDPAIRSIRSLFAVRGKTEYQTDDDAALYYAQRLDRLLHLWPQFAPDRRVALTHSDLVTRTDAVLAQISDRLAIRPVLENRYVSPAASRRGGGGDPTASGAHQRIVARAPDAEVDALTLTPGIRAAVDAAFARFCALTTA